MERLAAAGVLVEDTNARAAALAGAIVAPAAAREGVWAPFSRRASAEPDAAPAPPPGAPAAEASPLLAGSPRVINVGLARFAESLRAQGAAVVDVDWRPPADGNRAMLELLEKLE